MKALEDAPTADRDGSLLTCAEVSGRFRILGELGAGGAARVFLAVARGPGGFNKLLVLKQPRQEVLAATDWKVSFLEEARLAARLNHPNIVQTYEVTEEQGLPCIVMEYLDGQPLSQIIAKCGELLTLAMQLRIIADALAGLHYAHELTDYDGTSLGLVHRDMSPQNVFVTFDGQVKVLDFGIAKVSRSTTETEAGLIKGKLHYMPPEQITKDAIDRRSDIYAVGVMLWEAVAGQRMWKGLPEGAVLKRVILGDIPSLGSVRPDVPKELEAICTKALSVDRQDRFATAAELESELEAVLEKLDSRVSNRAIGKMLSKTLADARAATKRIIDQEVGKVASLTWEEYRTYQAGSLMRFSGNQSGTLREVQLESAAKVVARKGTLRSLWFAIGLALAIGLSVVAGFIMWNRARLRSGAPAIARAPETPSLVSSKTSRSPAASAQVEDPPSKSVRVRLSAHPAEARLYWDGVLLPSNPFESSMEADNNAHTLRAVASGYESTQTSIILESNVDLVLSLQRNKSERSAPLRARPVPPAPVNRPRKTEFVEEM